MSTRPIKEARSRYHQPDDIDPILTGGGEDVDDFSALSDEQAMAMANKVFSLGHDRKVQLDELLPQDSDGEYRIPNAHKGQYADFHDQSNYEYLNKKYPWLHTGGAQIGIDDGRAEESHGDLETFLASIPHEDWSSFLIDLAGMEDYPYLDEDRATELEIEEQGRWMTEDGGPDLIKAMVKDCDDAYEAYLLSKVTPDMIWEWSRETDNYPESQGDGSVYMNMEKLAKERENQEWFLDQLDDDVAGWTALKRAFYDEPCNASEAGLRREQVSDLFDRLLHSLASEDDEQIATAYQQLDAETLWQMFLQTFPNERREADDPYWYRWRPNYDLPYEWKVGFEPSLEVWDKTWQTGYQQALEQLKGTPWFLKLIGTWFNRGPENHPELKFEQVQEASETDPDDPETFMRHGGGRMEEVIYEDDKIVVMYPREYGTLNHHLRKLGLPEIDQQRWNMSWRGNRNDIFVVLHKEAPDLTGDRVNREVAVLQGDADHVTVYTGVYGNTDRLAELFQHPEYGRNIRRMLLQYYREQVTRDEQTGNVLMQLGGVSELKRAERKGHLDLRRFQLPIGLHYVKQHKYALAAKTFARSPKTLTPQGVWLIYDDVSDLTGVFKNEDAASTVFAYDHYDWFDYYWDKGNRPEVSDVLPFLDQKAMAHLRSVMVNRRVYFPDGGPDAQGEYVTLTKKLIDGYDDDTLRDWLANPSEEDIEDGVWEDIIEAIQLAGVDILSAASQDEVHTGFVKAAVEAIGGVKHQWGRHPTKATKAGPSDSFEVFVPWRAITEFAKTYRENNSEEYEGSLENLATEANADTIEPDVNSMEAGWRDVNKEWAAENLNRIYELEPPKAYVDPAQTELSLPEALDPDSPDSMGDKLLSGVPVEFENRVKAILKDSTDAHGYTVRDLQFKYDAALQHSEEAIDAADGRLFNYPPHQILLVIYQPEPAPDWDVTRAVFEKVRAAAVNTYRDFSITDDYVVHPHALALSEDLVVFQFSLYPASPASEPFGEEVPF